MPYILWASDKERVLDNRQGTEVNKGGMVTRVVILAMSSNFTLRPSRRGERSKSIPLVRRVGCWLPGIHGNSHRCVSEKAP